MTLAIAEDGVALREVGGAVQLLTTEKQKIDSQSIADALQANQALLKGRSVELVLTNKFLRFTVVPWQSGVYKRDDWQSLASHAFREQYGSAADQWQVKVSLSQAEEPVVATAIDDAIYDVLMHAAKQLQFEWQSITPVAMRLLNHAKRHYWATLIVEPQHLLMCEQTPSQFNSFQVMSPPAGQEATLAKQMLARWQLTQPADAQQKPLMVHVSGHLTNSWVKDHQGVNVTVEMAKQQHRTHAGWLTTV